MNSNIDRRLSRLEAKGSGSIAIRVVHLADGEDPPPPEDGVLTLCIRYLGPKACGPSLMTDD